MKTTGYSIGGFEFATREEMQKAKKELEGIAFVKEQIDMQDPEKVLAVYRRLIDEKVFSTVAGYSYLYGLQQYLLEVPYMKQEEIPAIAVKGEEKKEQENRQNHRSSKQSKGRQDSRRSKTEKHTDYRQRFRVSLYINVIVITIILAMFAITATSGNINIINYENKIIEKYVNWEEELKTKEESLREREIELRQKEEEEP